MAHFGFVLARLGVLFVKEINEQTVSVNDEISTHLQWNQGIVFFQREQQVQVPDLYPLNIIISISVQQMSF